MVIRFSPDSKTSFILASKREKPDLNPFFINKTKSNNGTNKTVTNKIDYKQQHKQPTLAQYLAILNPIVN
jgi:hypothetical protein